jgi:hypothetical protein
LFSSICSFSSIFLHPLTRFICTLPCFFYCQRQTFFTLFCNKFIYQIYILVLLFYFLLVPCFSLISYCDLISNEFLSSWLNRINFYFNLHFSIRKEVIKFE